MLKNSMTCRRALAIGMSAALPAMALANITTFDSGTEGWSVSGRDDISLTGGNPGANMDVTLIDVFGADIRNEGNPDFQGDFSNRGPIRFTVDVKVDSITFFGGEVPRDLVVELRDNTPSSAGLPYVSVWYNLGTLTASNPGWHTYSVDIADPTSATLPAGWGGYGDEDPVTFEPILPSDRSFQDVLASVDEIHFTTFVPGWFFGFTNFEISVDNAGYAVIPEPGSLALLGLVGFAALRRR